MVAAVMALAAASPRSACGIATSRYGCCPSSASTRARSFLLNLLWRDDGRTQTELATECGVEAPTISRGVQRLERAGLVTRRQTPTMGAFSGSG